MGGRKNSVSMMEEEKIFSRVWLSSLLDFLSGTTAFYYLVGLSALVLLVASMFGVTAMYKGYRHVYGVYREIPWGILISGYVFFAVTSTGITLVSALGHVFGVKSLIPIAKRSVYLAAVTILTAFMIIFFDLENPFRMALWNVLSPNFTSNIWWMGTLYGASLIFMTFEFIMLLLERHRYAMSAGLLGLISKIAACSNLGAVFGMLYGREFWYGPYMPVYFIACAAVAGCTAIIFFTYLGYKITAEKMDRAMLISLETVGKVWAVFLAGLIFFTAWNILTGLAASEGKVLVIKEMLFGKYTINFWFFEVLLGMILPFFLLLMSGFRNINQMFIASVFSFIGMFFRWTDFVQLGQSVSHYFKYNVIDFPVFLSYTPSIYEIMLIVGGISFCIMAFLIGEKVFKGHKTEIH